MARTQLHTCMLCEAACGLVVETEDNRVLSVRGDKDDPLSRGHICPKATAIADVTADPDRVRAPQRRDGDRWETVSWERALSEAAERIAAVQKRHGRNAVAVYLGNPVVHSYSGLLTVPLFSRMLGTKSRFSATSVDQLPHMLASLEMFGHQLALPVPDLDRTQFLLVLGANPLVSNGSIMTAPGVAGRLRALRERGGRLVVVDPRRTETAAVADQHLFIRPGQDALLLLALIEALFAERLADPGRLASFTDGVDAVAALARRFPAERVAPRLGIAPAVIRQLARDFARSKPAACYGRVGVCTQAYGGLAAWLVLVLNVITGNLDEPGGAMFATPAADLVRVASGLGERGHFGLWKSRVRGLPEFSGELPAATLAEEIETPGDGQIRALVTFAGNPVLSTPNGARLERALAKLDTIISIDIYRNETTRHAHLLLPTTFGFERDHYDLAFYALSVRNVARYTPAILEPPPETRPDWQVLLDLALRVHAEGGGRRDRKLAWTAAAARRLGPRRVLAALLRFGPHGRGLVRRRGISLGALEATPHGVDLGPLERRLPDILAHPDRRVKLAPAVFLDDARRLEAELEAPAASSGDLVLIGRRRLRSHNSWLHNSLRLVKGPAPCTLLMHPDDARARGLSDGDEVRVSSRVGAIQVPLAVTEDIAPGVVSLPHGFGHHRSGAALAVAAAHAGASINDLTDEAAVDPLSGNASFSGVPVSVARAGRAASA